MYLVSALLIRYPWYTPGNTAPISKLEWTTRKVLHLGKLKPYSQTLDQTVKSQPGANALTYYKLSLVKAWKSFITYPYIPEKTGLQKAEASRVEQLTVLHPVGNQLFPELTISTGSRWSLSYPSVP
jgi:hypothetical protein